MFTNLVNSWNKIYVDLFDISVTYNISGIVTHYQATNEKFNASSYLLENSQYPNIELGVTKERILHEEPNRNTMVLKIKNNHLP